MKNKYWESLISISGIASIFIAWEIYSSYANNFTIPGPIECLYVSLLLAIDSTFLHHVLISLMRLISGMAIGCFLGIVSSITMTISKGSYFFFNPIVRVIGPIPPIAWSPLLIIIFGIDNSSKIALIAIGAFCLTHANSINELMNIPSKYVSISKQRSKGIISTIFNVYLPYLLPSLLVSIEIVFSISWILLIAAETMISDDGIGWYIWDRRMYGFYDEMFAAIIWLGVLASAMSSATKIIRIRFCGWCIYQ